MNADNGNPPQAYEGIDDAPDDAAAFDVAELVTESEINDLAKRGTDLDNSAFFARRARGRLMFNHPAKSWMVYDGNRWSTDNNGAAVRIAKEVVREMQRVAIAVPDDTLRMKAVKHALESQSRRKIEAMMFFAQSDLPADPSSFNRDPYALNLVNGTLDVRTRTLRAHDPGDFITKLAPVSFDPAADCERWRKFVVEIMDGDAELVDFLQRFVGLCLTGLVVERLLAILHGAGANGKSTLLNVMLALLGDYGVAVDPALFAAQHDAKAASPELVRLNGARFVSASELPEGRLSESLLKRYTGNDMVTARALYCDTIQFVPTWKIVFATNHRPPVRDDSEGFWDRLHLVPFAARFEGQRRDPTLGGKLAEELAGILNWALDGFDRWQEHGLNRPGRISSATSAYRADSDVVGAFISECWSQIMPRCGQRRPTTPSALGRRPTASGRGRLTRSTRVYARKASAPENHTALPFSSASDFATMTTFSTRMTRTKGPSTRKAGADGC